MRPAQEFVDRLHQLAALQALVHVFDRSEECGEQIVLSHCLAAARARSTDVPHVGVHQRAAGIEQEIWSLHEREDTPTLADLTAHCG
jgi:hypothetical protein